MNWHNGREEQERIARELKETKEKELRDFTSVLKDSNRRHKATNLRHYIDAMEQKTNANPEWLSWACKKADWYDPFTKSDDELLQNVNRNSLKFEEPSAKQEEDDEDWLS